MICVLLLLYDSWVFYLHCLLLFVVVFVLWLDTLDYDGFMLVRLLAFAWRWLSVNLPLECFGLVCCLRGLHVSFVCGWVGCFVVRQVGWVLGCSVCFYF